MPEWVTVRNVSNRQTIIGERYLFPGESRRVRVAQLERAAGIYGSESFAISGMEPEIDMVSSADNVDLSAEEQPVADSAVTVDAERIDWTEVDGIDDVIADALYYQNLNTADDLLNMILMQGEKRLRQVPGIGPVRLRALIDFAEEAAGVQR